jgi:hypothetical protein
MTDPMKSLKLQFAIGLWLALVLAFPATADIYSWTDENGVVRYSDHEPLKTYDDLTVVNSIPHDPEADRSREEMDRKEGEALQQDIDAEDAETGSQFKEKTQQNENKPPTREERIEAEKTRLKNKIAEINKKPLSAYGSRNNKRRELTIYIYKLEELEKNPDAYFEKSKDPE